MRGIIKLHQHSRIAKSSSARYFMGSRGGGYTIHKNWITTQSAGDSGNNSITDGPLHVYHSMVESGEIISDNHQLAALQRLQTLYDEVLAYDAKIGRSHRQVISPSSPSSSTSSSTSSSSSSSSGGGGWLGSIFSSNAKQSSSSSTSATVSSTIFSRFAPTAPASLYLHGGTGCGKTFLMDMFFDALPIQRKRRVHFHNFMIDIHKRLHKIKMQTNKNTRMSASEERNAMDQITSDLMADAYLICFDEFQVTDIADAMMLKSLFTSMFEQGVVVVATSNRPPNDLYKNGLQRNLFIPFIKLLEERSIVHSLTDSTTDYRLTKSEQIAKDYYLSPLNKINKASFDGHFNMLVRDALKGTRLTVAPTSASSTTTTTTTTTTTIGTATSSANTDSTKLTVTVDTVSLKATPSVFTKSLSLPVYGHQLRIPAVAYGRRIAMFTFAELCADNLGSSDYIELAKVFNNIFISNIPQLSLSNRNELRRFITLIDALYEGGVTLVALAAAPPTQLLPLSPDEKASSYDEVFAFDRTISRLLEMQSQPYVTASKEKRPGEVDAIRQILIGPGASQSGGSVPTSLKSLHINALWHIYVLDEEKDVIELGDMEVLLLDMAEVRGGERVLSDNVWKALQEHSRAGQQLNKKHMTDLLAMDGWTIL